MSRFISDGHPAEPYAFLQWKNTDACFDLWCECGRHLHFDGYFAYTVRCPRCDAIYEMPCYLILRRADERTQDHWRENPRPLEDISE